MIVTSAIIYLSYTTENLIVLEFMHNGSLENFLKVGDHTWAKKRVVFE